MTPGGTWTALLDGFVDWLYHVLDRLAVAAVLWLCGAPDQPWNPDL